MLSVPRAVATLLVVSLSIFRLRAANVETLGIVVTSRSATLGNGIVSDGATLCNGDFSLLPLAISAAGASLGLAARMSTLGEITLIDRKSFEIRSRRGLLKIAYFGDSE
ncbi:MAG TPA: hypothetical protein VGG58_02245 [Candidatus Acidoferrum sp.]|jgi:hypothetical protein